MLQAVDTLQATVEVIDKETAKRYLACSDNIRAIDLHRVKGYARMMVDGQWDENGEAIKFDREGKLRDGQHRLSAIVLCGLPQPMLVVRGIASDHNLDRGKSRSISDYLRRYGVPNAVLAAAAIRGAINYNLGKFNGTSTYEDTVTVDQLVRFREDTPDADKIVSLATRGKQMGVATYLGILGLVIASSTTNSDTFYSFMDDIQNSDALPSTDPRWHLHRRMIANKLAKKVKLTGKEKCALTFVAWNHYIEGREATVNTLRWRAVGPGAQEFPKITLPSEVE